MDNLADQMLDELEASISDLITNFGNHDGDCTNAAQLRNAAKVGPCSKHKHTLEKRTARVESALMQFKALRNLFGSGVNNEQRTL